MGIDSKKIPVRLTLNIDEIEAFREELDENEKKDGCIIYMKSGESYWINEDYEYFSKRL